ncbi:hypothetical protein H310_11117 [Aphanomyces invadans]|uniref:Uncharacterized protein n=1 Tax=Aphanomyces invadans TaxID=157072 RepID=A0A024TPZ7_9STRA|nr:hypothetical protein H310_11117 [Aphanomyces invadans]ETV95701.1 hypothetical protein H310_11117 [Aphanomyces invadans]|eukprot:XP_008875894.1 hypothetical protein H310_11117 [Aphanomyces invadans]
MGEMILEALVAADAFQEQHEIEKIYKADQTGINFEYIPKKTIRAKGTGDGLDKGIWT